MRKEKEKGERKRDRKRKRGGGGINCFQLGRHDKKPKFLSVRPLGQDYRNKTRAQNLQKGLD